MSKLLVKVLFSSPESKTWEERKLRADNEKFLQSIHKVLGTDDVEGLAIGPTLCMMVVVHGGDDEKKEQLGYNSVAIKDFIELSPDGIYGKAVIYEERDDEEEEGPCNITVGAADIPQIAKNDMEKRREFFYNNKFED
jgi:hypothetical protein